LGIYVGEQSGKTKNGSFEINANFLKLFHGKKAL